MKNLVSFENTYIQTHEDFAGSSLNDAVFESITIDGYPDDENEPGEVVAECFITLHGDLVTAWHLNGYRLDEDVLALINESYDMLRNDFMSQKGTKS